LRCVERVLAYVAFLLQMPAAVPVRAGFRGISAAKSGSAIRTA
jgi:hypothetical protein